MARYLFVPYSARGHVNPTLAVVSLLAARGDSVRVVADARFAAEVTRAGAVPVVPDVDHSPWSPPNWSPRQTTEWLRVWSRRQASLRSVRAAYVRELREFRPDAAVVDSMHPPPVRSAAGSGIPVVWLSTTHVSARRPGTVLVNAVPELQPEWPGLGARHRLVGPLLRAVPTVRRRSRQPTLVVSPGTVFARDAEFFRAIIDQFAGTEWFVLVATGHLDPERLGPLPSNVVAERWIAQRSALETATVFLTHGGMNSVQEALCAGVPMLLAPRNREQRTTARRLAALGVGALVTKSVLAQAERIRADRRIQRVMRDMRRRMHERDGPGRAAEVLASVVARDG